ncbi:protein SET DOMAIN GROUP 40 isoform X2 [Cornus florida]|nr:protein SET DOMAIN GROUP 40 isoform X2 [Cornus florida]
MTSDSLLEDQTLSLAVNKHPFLSSTQILVVLLLNEMGKGKNSWWNPYLMQLPRSYETLASFDRFETQALQVDDAIWAAEKARLKAELDWKEATSLMKELKLKPQLRTFKAWLWASATISSRTLHIPWDNAGCLCPVGDFFNYSAPGEELSNSEDSRSFRNASCLHVCSLQKEDATQKIDAEKFDANLQRLTDGGYEEDVTAYCFYARRNYKKGEQVLLSYGTYTNLELLEHYGFLLNENPNDKVFIPLEPEIYSSCSWPKELLYIHQNGKPSFALLSAIRLWATPPSQRRSVGHLAYSGSQLSPENEVIVMGRIAKNCHVILKNFQTSVEEDYLLLHKIDKLQHSCTPMELSDVLSASGGEACAFLEVNGVPNGESGVKLNLSSKTRRSLDRWKLAVEWRLSYKKTFGDCISYCTDIINKLSSQNGSTMRTI